MYLEKASDFKKPPDCVCRFCKIGRFFRISLERVKIKMNKTASNVVKGLAAGAAVGAAAYMITSAKSKKSSRALKKGAGKAIKAVGTIVDNVATMMK